jgi:transcription termination factor NusA
MQKKEKKPKKKSIEELRMILDDIPVEDLINKDEKHLIALGKRLDKSKKEVTYKQIESIKKEISGETTDPLKPTVVIHQRKIKEPKTLKFIEVEKKEITVEKSKPEEKVPEFIEVKPKITTKHLETLDKIEKTTPTFIPIEEKETTEPEPDVEEETNKEKHEPGEIVEEKLPEWEPVIEKTVETKEIENVVDEIPLPEPKQKEESVETDEQEEDVNHKIEVFKELESVDYDTSIMLYDKGFLSVEDLKLASVDDLIKIVGIKKKTAKKIRKEIDEIEQSHRLKPVIDEETEDKTLEIDDKEEKRQEIDTETKLEAFKDMKSISKETAVLLYNNHITSIDELKNVTLTELTRIQGIKKKTAREVIKELDKIEEENLKVKPIKLGESAEGEVTKDQIEEDEEKVEDKELIPSPVELKRKSAEWAPTPEEEMDDKKPVEKEISEDEPFLEHDIEKGIPDLDIGKKKKIAIFKGVKAIDDKTSVLLYDNGFTSIDALTIASVKDLTKINGIKKKTAKKIKKELDEKIELGPLADEDSIDDFTDVKSEFDEDFYNDTDEESFELDEKILEYEPSPEKDDLFGEEEEIEKLPIIEEHDERTDVFKDVESIDEKTAQLLVENGITSIGDLMEKTIKDLTRIRGIKKKLAKEIKREISIIIETPEETESFSRDENHFIDEEAGEWDSIGEVNGYKHEDFVLYEKEIDVKGGKKRRVRFFSKETPDEGKPIDLPDGYEVKGNKKTGVPHLRKKK